MIIKRSINSYKRSRNFKVSLFACLLLSQTIHAFSRNKNYFQQDVNYNIEVILDDSKNELRGFEKIEYVNNSPDTLHEIYIHLYPNAYKDQSTELAKQLLENRETVFYYSEAKDRGFIDSLEFKVNSISAKFILDAKHPDVGKLILNRKLYPGQSITITTPFHVKLPNANFSRLGYLDQAYMISQWYPKPAVYDETGWHQMPYLNLGEFYGEFGNFEVSITLPKNYVVGATGILQDSAELKWLDQKAEETENTIRFPNAQLQFPNSDTELKTLHYSAKAVHDFAWFADKRYHVLKNEIVLPQSQRKVTSWTMFTNAQTAYWRQTPQIIKESILYYSEHLGEYPYDQVSVVDGTVSAGSGMEYPMITVIGNSLSFFDFEYTVLHELGHNWFYGILANNERDFAWMDEGLNTYYNLRFMEAKFPNSSFLDGYIDSWYLRFANMKKLTHKTQYVLGYLSTARKNLDQSCSTASADFTESNYGNIVYSKTGFNFHYLSKYLGEAKFDSIMKIYYSSWKFKHPKPEDLRFLFERETGKNLNWFFDDLLGSTKKLDYKIKSFKKQDSLNILRIKNKGKIQAPISLTAIRENNTSFTIWQEGFSGTKTIQLPAGKYKSFVLDSAWNALEINRNNNSLRSKGILKKIEPLRFQLLGSIEDYEKTVLNYFPVIGFNTYDQVMAGVAFYSNPFLERNFDYLFVPLYAFGSKEINGAAQVAYRIRPNGIFQEIKPELAFKKYSLRREPLNLGFYKIAGALEFTLRKSYARSPFLQKFKLISTGIAEDETKYSSSKNEYEKQKLANQYYVNSLSYKLKNGRKINPFELFISLEQGKNYLKTSLEGFIHFSYKQRKKSADIRVFAGKMLYENEASPLFGFAMNGNNDYTYDNIYLGRNSTSAILNQQVYMKDGSFKNLSLTSNSLNWMLAMNLLLPAPGKIPLALYADIGKASTSEKLDYDIGVALIILKNYIEIYAPIKQSSDLNQLNYAEKIRFVIHLNAMNPLAQIKKQFN